MTEKMKNSKKEKNKKKSPLQQKSIKSSANLSKDAKISAPRCMRTRFPIPAKPVRKHRFCIFSTPLVRKRENSGSEKGASKVPFFCQRKKRDDENVRRALGESAIFDRCKTRARAEMTIFVTPLVRKCAF